MRPLFREQFVLMPRKVVLRCKIKGHLLAVLRQGLALVVHALLGAKDKYITPYWHCSYFFHGITNHKVAQMVNNSDISVSCCNAYNFCNYGTLGWHYILCNELLCLSS